MARKPKNAKVKYLFNNKVIENKEAFESLFTAKMVIYYRKQFSTPEEYSIEAIKESAFFKAHKELLESRDYILFDGNDFRIIRK